MTGEGSARPGRPRREAPTRRTAVLVIAGPAGSGTSTLGAALARRTGRPLLDLDTLTNPLLDELDPYLAPGTGTTTPGARWCVPPRYACLLVAASEQVRGGVGAVLVAFTAELAGRDDWRRLLDAVAPVRPVVCWLDAADLVRSARVAARGAARDRTVPAEPGPTAPPRVTHLRLDATLPAAELLDRVLHELSP